MKKVSRARVLPRTEFGNPILTRKAKHVPRAYLTTRQFTTLTRDLLRTMRATGGVGIAAPQVGVPLAIAVMEIRPTKERREATVRGPLVIVNPRIVSYGTTTRALWEGCLSFQKIFGKVPRATRVTVEYWNEEGEKIVEKASGLWAHIFQHEIDHLNGIRYIDRLEDPTTLMTPREFEKYIRPTLRTTSRREAKKRRPATLAR